MAIRDRGKIKWLPAAFLPEQTKSISEALYDLEKSAKPILDEYQIEEIENQICYAMEYYFSVTISIWESGLIRKVKGYIRYLEPLKKEIRMEVEHNNEYIIERISFDKVTAIDVEEY
ncbi:YolD-like family protein [Niallia sp. MER 6]|uniref:YolD-like family protein n=1 Tax=Niallia sp. MER 6 TaxID=2939567 RepID=UPI00204111F7|nr:YolD-like family protein [Niallia sp. MER 6]MCM3032843.1 YolD-like family protein [Niallia sp. MER 6]